MIFNLTPPFNKLHPIDTDKLAWIAGARAECFQQLLAAGGELYPTIFTDIDEALIRSLNVSEEEVRTMQMIGSWIIQDREWQKLTAEEKEAELQKEEEFAAELLEELPEEYEELQESLVSFLAEKMKEKNDFDEIARRLGEGS